MKYNGGVNLRIIAAAVMVTLSSTVFANEKNKPESAPSNAQLIPAITPSNSPQVIPDVPHSAPRMAVGQRGTSDASPQVSPGNPQRSQEPPMPPELVADYIVDWSKRIELAGRQLFPQGVPSHKVTAEPFIEAAMLADGRLRSVTLHRTSGDAEVDAAILRVVYLAEPYAAFTAEMKTSAEILLIQSTWRIGPDGAIGFAQLPRAQSMSDDDLKLRSQEIARRQAALNETVEVHARRPRVRILTTASTPEYKYASYLVDWERKVEKVGSLNYPDEAKRGGIQGDLLLDVAINHDGTVVNVQVRRSSGHAILDDAARRIVHLAAPFAPFPPDFRKEFDVLRITCTWKFSDGKLELE